MLNVAFSSIHIKSFVVCKRDDFKLKQTKEKPETYIKISINLKKNKRTYLFTENTKVKEVVKRVYSLVADKSVDYKEYVLARKETKVIGFPYDYTLKQCGFQGHVHLQSIFFISKLISSYSY